MRKIWFYELTIFLIRNDLLLNGRLTLQSTMQLPDSFWVCQLTIQEAAIAVFLHDFRSRVPGELAKSVAGVHDGIVHNLSVPEHKD